MGAVYRARDAQQRDVAIKALRATHAEPRARDRFLREARSMARLSHPHVVALREVLEQDDAVFLVMEYVPGESLQQRLRRGPLPPDEARERTAQLAAATAHAHARGVLHRDLKPDNVLLGTDGVIRLTDFGVAYVLETGDGERLTRTGAFVGTPGYMAPEQALSQLDAIDRRTDVYGLGATLYAMLTGDAPIRGADLHEVLVRTIEHAPTPPHQLRPEVPLWLSRVCLRCLEKDPVRRFENAEELIDALNTPAPAGRPHRFAAGAILAATLLGAGALLFHAGATPGNTSPSPEPPALPTATAQQQAAEHVRRGEEHVKQGQLEQALAAFEQAPQLDPQQQVPALWGQARIFLARRDQDALAQALSRLLALDPAHPGALSLRAEQSVRAGRHDEALRDLDQALTRAPGLVLALELRAFCLSQLGRREEAMLAYERLLQGVPPDSKVARAARYSMAVVLVQLGRHAEAIRTMDQVVAQDTALRGPALLQRGNAHQALGHFEQAVEDLTAGLELGGEPDPGVLHNRGCALAELGRWPEALADFRAVWATTPSAITGAAIAEALGYMGRDPEAEAWFTQVIERWPDAFYAREARGEYWLRRARGDLAVLDLEAALARGANVGARLQLIRARLLRGDEPDELASEVEGLISELQAAPDGTLEPRRLEQARNLLDELRRAPR
jgi:tetratricopeptide (TPR) repeat protein